MMKWNTKGLGWSIRIGITLLAITAGRLPGQNILTVLHSFTNNPDGAQPAGGVVLLNGNLYGLTTIGGVSNMGTMYSVGTNGDNYMVHHDFADTNDGYAPCGELLLSSGSFVATYGRGASSYDAGAAFGMDTNGNWTFVHVFTNGMDGQLPLAGLTRSADTLCGTTSDGGEGGGGTVFSIDIGGFTVLHSFGGESDGLSPSAPLVSQDGFLFGSTPYGPYSSGYGTVFFVAENGYFTNLHVFSDGPDGARPRGALAISGGMLYGTASGSQADIIFSINIFNSNFTVIHSFTNAGDGEGATDLLLSGDTLYGTTSGGGDNGSGTVFSIKTNGSDYQMLYSFGPVIDVVDGNSTNYDGISPKGKLLLSGHTLYGTTLGGGNGYGTVFSLRLCLCAPPPVITGIVLNTNQSVTISCLGDPLCKYFMKASTNLVVEMTNWLTISTNFAGTNGRWQVTDPIDLTGISVCSTNYLYGGGIDPNSTGTNVLGTNISCSYLLSPMFYRAAVP